MHVTYLCLFERHKHLQRYFCHDNAKAGLVREQNVNNSFLIQSPAYVLLTFLLLVIYPRAVAASLLAYHLLLPTPSNIDLRHAAKKPRNPSTMMKPKSETNQLEAVSNAVSRGTLYHGKPMGSIRSVNGGEFHVFPTSAVLDIGHAPDAAKLQPRRIM